MIEDALNDMHPEATGANFRKGSPFDARGVAGCSVITKNDFKPLSLQIAREPDWFGVALQRVADDICARLIDRQYNLFDRLIVHNAR